MNKLKYIIEGETGSGKTYFSIKKSKELGNFCYLAPCRQLAYESAIKYGSKKDTISTGEVYLYNSNSNNNFFGVYESMTPEKLKNYKSLIVDEAHYLYDYDRGKHLAELIHSAEKMNKNIFLVTATRNFRKLKSYKLITLKSLFSKKIRKKRISVEEFWRRVDEGIPSILFCKYKESAERYDYHITADTPSSERLKTQLAFARGEITFVATTNVLAQGLNFPAQNILIEYNEYDNDELIVQKMGRLGRYGLYNGEELTYCLAYKPGKIKKKKEIQYSEEPDMSEEEIMGYFFDILAYSENYLKKIRKLNQEGNIKKDRIIKKYLSAFKGAKSFQNIKSKYGYHRTKKFINSLTKKEFEKLKSMLLDDFIDYFYFLSSEEEKLKKLLMEELK